MRLHWPWASWGHRHPIEIKPAFVQCAGCGHLLIAGHSENVLVEEEIRCYAVIPGATVKRTLTYGPGCAPHYRKRILFEDGTRKELP